eukprot:COSAG02_NODE_15681_length_1149_cov_0.977143_1_plen_113_part_00
MTPTGADFCTGKGLWGADGGTWLDRRGADGVEVVPYRDGSSFCFLFLPIPTNEPDTLVGEIDERSIRYRGAHAGPWLTLRASSPRTPSTMCMRMPYLGRVHRGEFNEKSNQF